MNDYSQRIADLPPEKIRLLAQRIAQKKARLASEPPLGRRAGGRSPLPLSYAQKRLWVLHQLEPHSAAFNLSSAVRIEGRLNVGALERSLREVLRRHEVLRTSFELLDGEPVQVVHPPAEWPLPIVDLEALAEGERVAKVRELSLEEAVRPFDLERGPVLRTKLLRQAPEQHVLLFTMHHIASDGWSMGVFVREVASLYMAYERGQESPLPELAVQYGDYAEWQREWLRGAVLDEQLEYWKRQLSGPLPVLKLPTDRARPPVASYRGRTESFVVGPALTAALRELTRREGATLFMTLLAAFDVLLYQYTRQEDIIVGTNVANRNRRATEGLIGFFINNLALRADLSGDPTFRECLGRVREAALGAFAHQDVPFEMVVEAIHPERAGHHAPLFQVMFVLQNAPAPSVSLEGLTLSLVEVESEAANFDLSLFVREASEGLACHFVYDTELFAAGTVERMRRHFENLMHAIALAPDTRLSAFNVKTAAEDESLTRGFSLDLEEADE